MLNISEQRYRIVKKMQEAQRVKQAGPDAPYSTVQAILIAILKANSMNLDLPLKVGLVGFGKVAEVFHAPLIKAEPDLKITHVVERHRNRSEEVLGDVQVVRSCQELWQTDIDMAVILTPNEYHFPQARDAITAGKHVVVDKPFTITSAEADQLAELAEREKRVLSVFHNRRWDGDFLTVKKLLDDGSLGRLVEFESRFDRFRPQTKGGWREEARPGSGILYDLGSHLADQALQLFGEPTRIWADVRLLRDGAVADDFFEIVADFGEVRVTLKATCVAPEQRIRFLLRGTKGGYTKYGLDGQEDRLKEGAVPGSQDWGVEPELGWGILHRDERAEPLPTLPGDYPAYYRDVAQAIRNERAASVTAGQAGNVIRFLELAELSSQEGRWVELADIGSSF